MISDEQAYAWAERNHFSGGSLAAIRLAIDDAASLEQKSRIKIKIPPLGPLYGRPGFRASPLPASDTAWITAIREAGCEVEERG